MDYRQTLHPGTVLDGKYRIERILGAGGFGITYEAFDVRLASMVAMKEYFPSQFGVRDTSYSVRPRSEGDRDIFERLRASFLREARTLNQFDHPAIVRVLNVFEAYGTAYMVMKYETGPSLKSWLADLARLPTQDELDRLTAPLLDALETMHSAAFLHRDIAPDNIIVRADGSPVLLDFGASRRVMGEMSGTLTGVVKKGYSPQEQYATDGRSQGPWTDIYSMGATLYRSVSGDTPEEATQRMLDDQVVSAVEAGGERYRPSFLTAIDAAMMVRPEARPQSIAAWRCMLFEDALSWRSKAHTRWSSGGIEVNQTASHLGRNPDQEAHPVPPEGADYAPRGVISDLVFPLQSELGSSRRWKKTVVAVAAGALALIGGGAFLAGSKQLGLREVSVQPATLTDGESTTSKLEVTSQLQDPQVERLTRHDATRATEETLRRRAEERQRAAEEARWQEAAEARTRELAAEIEARRRAEALQRQQQEQIEQLKREAAQRAAESERQRAAEEVRQRKLAEEAEARRLAEETQRQQQAQIEHLKREAALRAAEVERQRAAEEMRQRKLAEEAEARRRAEETQRQQQSQIEQLKREAAQRAAEVERQRIEDETHQRKLAEEAELRRTADKARRLNDDAEEATKQSSSANKRVALLTPAPPPLSPTAVFNGTWLIVFNKSTVNCRGPDGRFRIDVFNGRVVHRTPRGTGTGHISSSGSIRWTVSARSGNALVDWVGTLKGTSGSGNYTGRGIGCYGKFTAQRE